MGLDVTFPKAKETSLRVSAPFTNADTATKPTAVTISLTAAAEAGDTSLAVAALPVALKANTILDFVEGSDVVTVLVTANADEGDTTLAVDGLRGDVGDGIPSDIDAAATATWDRLYRVLGTETADVSYTEGVTTYTSNTYDSAFNVVYDTATIDTAGWTISRAGRQKINDYGYRQCHVAATTKLPVWVKLERPGEDNLTTVTYEGVAWLTGFSDTGAATALNDGGWTFTGNGKIYVTYAKQLD